MNIKDLNAAYLKNWQNAINRSDFRLAINLDYLQNINIVKKNENSEYWDIWQNKTYEDRLDLIKKFNEINPLRQIKKKNQKKLIVVPNYSGLAHEVQISRNLNYLKKIEFFEFEVVYLMGKKEGNEIKASNTYKIPVSKIFFLNSNNYEEAGKNLQKFTYERNYDSIIYISIFFIAYWMSVFINHPNQKFIVMKYYPRQIGRIKEWAGGKRSNDEYYIKNNEKFLQLPILNLQHTQEEGVPDYIFDEKKISLTFGSISRIEKINNIEYIKFINSILSKNLSLIYLYTGDVSERNELIEKIDCKNRVINLGWVDPVKAITKYDIYIEPFPWGGGEMTLLALQVGIPYLTLNTKENINIGLYSFLKIITINESKELKYSFCNNYEELEKKLKYFIENPDYRISNGKAWRKFIKLYKSNNLEHWSRFLMS